jgi:broad specificity phosphatase PhoE
MCAAGSMPTPRSGGSVAAVLILISSDDGIRAAGIRAQAAALTVAVAAAGADLTIASDLRRAAETADCVARALGLPLQLMPEWRELDVGAWTGLRRDDVRERWPEACQRFRAGAADARAEGGESLVEFRARIRRARQRTEGANAGRVVLVVTHRGVLRLLAPDVAPDHARLIVL